jgi:hypothetical protein
MPKQLVSIDAVSLDLLADERYGRAVLGRRAGSSAQRPRGGEDHQLPAIQLGRRQLAAPDLANDLAQHEQLVGKGAWQALEMDLGDLPRETDLPWLG